MQKSILIILPLLILLLSAVLKAQTITVTDIRSFTLQRLNNDGFIDLNNQLNVTLKATYTKDNQGREKLDVVNEDNTEKNFFVNYPFSRDGIIFQIIKLIDDKNPKHFSEYSLEQVVRWLYTLRQDDEGPRSGVLEIGRLAQVLVSDVKNNKERMAKMATWSTRFNVLSNSTYQNLNEAITLIKTAHEIIKNEVKNLKGNPPGSIDPLVQKLENVYMFLSAQDLPDLEAYDTNKKVFHSIDEIIKDIKVLATDSLSNIWVNQTAKQLAESKERLNLYQETRRQLLELKGSLFQEKVFPVEKISIQFERGNLERIQVWIYNEYGGLEIYENIYSIGFTGINNYRLIYATKLFLRKDLHVEDKSIFLCDILVRYDNLLDLYTRDYSPADTVINEHQTSAGSLILRRAQYVNLFDSKIFTDLQGINPEEPNGLIQLELSRRFHINSLRHQVGSKRMDYAWFSHFNAAAGITKIEKKLRQLPIRNLGKMVNNTIISPSYVTNMDLRRFENAFLNIDLNVFLFDWPDMKLTVYADIGARYAHVPMIDSLPRFDATGTRVNATPINFSAHTVSFSLPKINFEFFSERRVGFNLAFVRYSTRGFTGNRFKPIASYEKSNLEQRLIERTSRTSYMTELVLRVETNREGKGQLFLRNRLFWQKGDPNTYFMQTQLGYWYNIVFRK